jgi:hypothetical protein
MTTHTRYTPFHGVDFVSRRPGDLFPPILATAVASGATLGRHMGVFLHPCWTPRDSQPELTHAFQLALLVTFVAIHLTMLTRVPSIPGLMHDMTTETEPGIMFCIIISLVGAKPCNEQHNQSRHFHGAAMSAQPHDPTFHYLQYSQLQKGRLRCGKSFACLSSGQSDRICCLVIRWAYRGKAE